MAYNEKAIIERCLSAKHSEYKTHNDIVKHAEDLANRVVVKLSNYCKNGLPTRKVGKKSVPIYKNFDAYLSDFWPDLPWTEALRISVDRILHNNLNVVKNIKKRFGYDFEADLIRVREHGVW